MNADVLQVSVLGLLIFFARIGDVTLGTMRIVFISRGHKTLAPILGFFEVLVWLFALRIVMSNLTNISYYILFAAGFAAGTYVGLYIEEKLAIGTKIIRIVTRADASELIDALRTEGHGVTSVEAGGSEGGVHVLFSIVKRKNLAQFIKLVRDYNPRAFYSIEDVEFVSAGVFAARQSFLGRRGSSARRALAKSK